MNHLSDRKRWSIELFSTYNFSSPSSHPNRLLKRLNNGGLPGVLLTAQVYARAKMISDFLNNQLRGTLKDLHQGFEQRDREENRAESKQQAARQKSI
jgi:hypothetical protein